MLQRVHDLELELYFFWKRVKNVFSKSLMKYCNSMPFGAAWAYYGKVLVLANAAL